MINKNILLDRLGFFRKRKGDMSVRMAVDGVQKKFRQIAKALNLKETDLFKIDNFGVPFTGFRPSLLYNSDPTKLKSIKPLDVPTTLFITGDSADSKNLSMINKKFSLFDDIGMPNSHKLGQGLISKIVLDNPVYIRGKPLIPIGIDNYVFASPEDVVKRLRVIKIYKKSLEGKLLRSFREELEKALVNNYTSKARNNVKVNYEMVREFARIFPNSLKVLMTIEPPSAITEVGTVLSRGKPLAVIQVEYGVHPAYFDLFKNFYYLYMSDHPINVNESFPRNTKRNILVGHLPYMKDFSKMPVMSRNLKKKIVLSSGGAAGRIERMADEINALEIERPIEFILLTGVNKNSKEFLYFKNKYRNVHNKNIKFRLVPRVKLQRVIEIYSKSHASIALTGTFSTFAGIISGRPFGAVIDTRKTKDRIFTDHMITNAVFARDGFNYPVVIIRNKIKKVHIDKLLSDDFLEKAYKRAKEKGGIRDIFDGVEKKWRDVFVYFIK